MHLLEMVADFLEEPRCGHREVYRSCQGCSLQNSGATRCLIDPAARLCRKIAGQVGPYHKWNMKAMEWITEQQEAGAPGAEELLESYPGAGKAKP